MRDEIPIPKALEAALDRQGPRVERPNTDRDRVLDALSRLGLQTNDQVRAFFIRYRLTAVSSSRSDELLDILSPTPQIEATTLWARDIYELPEAFVALTHGEGDGFILLSKLDGSIFDVGADELSALDAGRLDPKWRSFFELLEWYLE